MKSIKEKRRVQCYGETENIEIMCFGLYRLELFLTDDDEKVRALSY
jgi:hypothetical protein